MEKLLTNLHCLKDDNNVAKQKGGEKLKILGFQLSKTAEKGGSNEKVVFDGYVGGVGRLDGVRDRALERGAIFECSQV